MKRFYVLLVCMLAAFTTSLAAQQPTLEPPDNPIVTPVSGKLAFSATSGLAILNTSDGTWEILPEAGGNPTWDPSGNFLMTIINDLDTANLISVNSSETRTITLGEETRSAGVAEGRAISGWSADGQQVMFLTHVFSGQTLDYGSAGHRLEIVDVATGTVNVVFETPPQTMMNTLFPVPEDSENVVLHLIDEVRWNPIHTEWVLIESVGVGKRASTGEDIGVYEAGLFNYVTREYISLKTLFPQTVISSTDWSADGRKIAMNTMTDINIISFSVEDGKPVLEVLADSIDSGNQAVLQWLGAGDLLVTGKTIPYLTTFIAQEIDNQWYSTEFIAIASFTPEYAGGSRDFFLTAEPEERNRLSCMFFDQVYPPQLQAGQRGRVTFTDGTPSRLRAEPGTEGEEVTQVQEGTPFDIVGGSYCVDDYRWWQVRLEDGTTGWAAEGTQSDYWLEPCASRSACL